MKKVLIIDDDLNLLVMLEAALSVKDMTVILAHDGEDGVKKFRREKPHLVILSAVLPQMSGYQVLRKIRSMENGGKAEVIVTIDKPSLKELFVSGRVHAFINKPILPDEFMESVESCMERVEEQEDRPSGPQAEKYVIIIGMDEYIRESVKKLLEAQGFGVGIYTDELAVINKLAKTRPSLIISQFGEEPEGFNLAEFNKTLRQNESFAGIPFRIACHHEIIAKADKEFSRSLMIMFREARDLLSKIEQCLHQPT